MRKPFLILIALASLFLRQAHAQDTTLTRLLRQHAYPLTAGRS